MKTLVEKTKTAPKPGSKQWKEYKAEVCELALKTKIKMDKLAVQLGEAKQTLQVIFAEDNSIFFCDYGSVKLDQIRSYSIEEQNIEKAKSFLQTSGLVIDDYIVTKTSFGVTAKLRSLIQQDDSNAGELKQLVTIKESESLSIKTA